MFFVRGVVEFWDFGEVKSDVREGDNQGEVVEKIGSKGYRD